MRDLSKRLRGASFRHAVEAVAALRLLDPATGAGLIPSTGTQDEQRAFQLLIARLVAEGGVHGLAARWRALPSPHWRELLVSEIGQAFHLWVEEGTIELLLAALDDPDDNVARRAVKLLTGCLREPAANERKEVAKTENLPWPTSIPAEKKGILPGTPFVRVWSIPTGLLDLKGLEDALGCIRRREG